jgi:hypothetical protein
LNDRRIAEHWLAIVSAGRDEVPPETDVVEGSKASWVSHGTQDRNLRAVGMRGRPEGLPYVLNARQA